KPDDRFALTDTYFRSAPLPLGDVLWVLIERRQALYLAQLEPKTGKLRGEPLKLCEYRDRMPQSIHRRIHAAHLAVADGVFVCPTGDGMLLGVDPAGAAILWAHRYEVMLAPEVLVRPGMPPGMVMLPDGRWVQTVPQRLGWENSPPQIHEDRVLFAPAEGGEFFCLSLRDGSLLWKQTKRDGDRYLA